MCAAGEHEGYRFLVDKPYLPPDFDQETFDELWRTWPEPLRARAAKATPDERRAMAFERYGLTPRPDDPKKPLQYVVREDGWWVGNCFLCHGGQIEGRVVPGLPNSNIALQTLTEDVWKTKLRLRKPPGPLELAALGGLPLGTTNGTTNAVVFGIVVFRGRDPDLNYTPSFEAPDYNHHDMDAPPWWYYKKKTRLYCDGFAKRDHRPLMQMLLVPRNGPDEFKEWEADYKAISRYLESLEPPRWPHGTDEDLAERGRTVFRKSCARCHGTYGEEARYPNKVVPLDEVGTDPVRLRAVTAAERAEYGRSWFAYKGGHAVVEEPAGYVAPPLDGAWASAPYFHNGSVPTLRHVLFPDERPKIWRRTPTGYDRERVGLEVETFEEVPAAAKADPQERRTYFDTRACGKSAQGHLFPAELSEADRRALLEYLKTL